MSIFEKLAEKWPSALVARSQVGRFTEGLYKAASLNALDAMGRGISPRYRIGRRVFYRVADVVAWGNNKIKDEETSNV